jgi:hypothetical protein
MIAGTVTVVVVPAAVVGVDSVSVDVVVVASLRTVVRRAGAPQHCC